MKIKFLKDHVDYKEGDIVHNHPNENYLITLGVAKEVKAKAETKAEGKKPGVS